jgi:hypothetical protein
MPTALATSFTGASLVSSIDFARAMRSARSHNVRLSPVACLNARPRCRGFTEHAAAIV